MRKPLHTGALLTAAACSTTRPVVYPTSHAERAGQVQVEADIAACRQLAENAGAKPEAGASGEAVSATARGGALGAATGAVGGAIAGDVLRGASIGAATGATAGLLQRLFSKPAPNPAYRNFVERCLRERGYEISGWN
jgi:hypothetical protein